MSQPHPFESQSLSLRELLAQDFPEPLWVVKTLIPEGLTILSGGPKAGKSWLALDIALSVATGGMLFKTLEVQPGKVIYIALEDNFRRLKERCLKLLAEGQTPNDNLLFYENFQKLDGAGLANLEELVRLHDDTVLIIIDTWGRAKPSSNGKQVNYEQETQFIGPLQRLALDHRLSVLVIHHTRKHRGSSDDPFDDVLGSTALTGVADNNIILHRNREGRTATLRATGRDTEDQELYIQLDQETMKWFLIDKPENALSENNQKILDCFTEGEELTPKQVTGKTGLNHDLVKKAMSRLKEQDYLIQVERGKYMKPVHISLPGSKPTSESALTETPCLSPTVPDDAQDLEDYLNGHFDETHRDIDDCEVVTSEEEDIDGFTAE